MIAGTTTPGGGIELDPNDIVRRMLTIRGLHNYRPTDLVTAIDFLSESSGKVPFELLQGDRFDLQDIETAFEASTARGGLRTAVVP